MKLFALLFFLTIVAGEVKAQEPPSEFPLMTRTWSLIAQRSYRQNKQREMESVFPPQLKALENTFIELPGYIIPLKVGVEFQVCYLSIVPIEQCFFCGSNGIPSMVEVHLLSPIRYSDKPVKIRGKLILNETADSRSEVFLLDAKIVK